MELEKFGTSGAISELLSIRDDVERISNLHLGGDGITPKVDLFDTGEAYQLMIDVPGVTQEGLEVAIQGRQVVVAGLREPIDEHVRILRSERPRGHFQRSIELPSEVERERTTAHLQEGVLVLTLPKS
ncbi:MAG: Hsp20/alpha crystallin family protein [Trueperaceae bacterium]